MKTPEFMQEFIPNRFPGIPFILFHTYCMQFILLALKKKSFLLFLFMFYADFVFLRFASQFHTVLSFSCFIGSLCHDNSDQF